MGTMDFTRETTGHENINNQGKHQEALPWHEFTIVHGAIAPNFNYARNKPWQTQAASDIYNKQYDVPRVIYEPSDVSFIMAPGRPQDRGSFEQSVYNSNPLQRRTVVQKLNMAANAPYTGIYTGLTGYVDE